MNLSIQSVIRKQNKQDPLTVYLILYLSLLSLCATIINAYIKPKWVLDGITALSCTILKAVIFQLASSVGKGVHTSEKCLFNFYIQFLIEILH